MAAETYLDFMERYSRPERPIIHLTPTAVTVVHNGHSQSVDLSPTGDDEALTPFIVVHGAANQQIVLNPILGLTRADDHLCVDAHGFLNGDDARVGAIGMDQHSPRQLTFTDAPGNSYGWPATGLVSLLVGEQS